MNLTALAVDTSYALRAIRKNIRLFCLSSLIVGLGAGACGRKRERQCDAGQERGPPE